MELLAPAGSRDSLVAAVQAGANAVYLGGKSFGARHYASNFSMEELKEAIQYCHLRNVSVYVTVNTLIHERELVDLSSYLEELGKIHIDGIIVQDLAVAKIARKVAPQIEIHGSTQMTVHNAQSAIALEKLGFSRIVLARELTLEEIHTICNSTQLEVEIFVHGALCIAYSGQCLLSSMIGGRSGNRGKCAQPCRLPYQLECNGKKVALPKGNHLLSPKDLNFINYLDQFREIGVASLKIEGRMKSPEYVATVVNSYRNALDKKSEEKSSSEKLDKVFNRGYSNGYLQSLSGKTMMSTEKPNNQGEMIGYTEILGKRNQIKLNKLVRPGDQLEVILENNEKKVIEISQEYDQYIILEDSLKIFKGKEVFRVFDSSHMKWAEEFYKNIKSENKGISLKFEINGNFGEPLKLKAIDSSGHSVEIYGEILLTQSEKMALTPELLKKQLGKLGGTPFELNDLVANIPESSYLPVSELNKIRRLAIEKLIEIRVNNHSKRKKDLIEAEDFDLKKPQKFSTSKNNIPKLSVEVINLEQLQKIVHLDFEEISFEGDFKKGLMEAKQILEAAKKFKKKVILKFPRILPEEDYGVYLQAVKNNMLDSFDGVYLSNLALVDEIKKYYPEIKIYGDFSLNIFNHISLEKYLDLGFDEVLVSPELTVTEVRELSQFFGNKIQILVHGFQEVMVSKFCMIGSYLGNISENTKCSHPCLKGSYTLRDRKDEQFPLVTDENCRMHIYNGKELSMLSSIRDLLSLHVSTWKIDGRFIGNERLSRIITEYNQGILSEKNITKDQEKEIVARQLTRGHYFRGVE